MDFLLDNPLATMEGPMFLVLYIFVILLSTVVVAAARSKIDSSDQLNLPAIPPEPDPYEVAFLRGGANEATRSVIFALVQKHLIEIVTDGSRSVLRPVITAGSVRGLAGPEQTAIDWIGASREVSEVFNKYYGLVEQMDPFFSAYRAGLENRQLLTSEEGRRQIKGYARTAAAVILLVGGYKVVASIAYGQFNFIFTIILALIGGIVVMSLGGLPRMTKLGRKYLERLQLAFDDLKYKAQAPYIRTAETDALPKTSFAGVDPLLLSVGLFGSGILTGTVYDGYNTAFHKAQQQQVAGSSGGCGSGTACGSGSSSGSSGGSCSGGGGCGGGCGGGGCGG